MKEVTELALLVVILLIAVVIWALLMATQAEPKHVPSGPIGLLWHPATPIVDWTPHTSTVLH